MGYALASFIAFVGHSQEGVWQVAIGCHQVKWVSLVVSDRAFQIVALLACPCCGFCRVETGQFSERAVSPHIPR